MMIRRDPTSADKAIFEALSSERWEEMRNYLRILELIANCFWLGVWSGHLPAEQRLAASRWKILLTSSPACVMPGPGSSVVSGAGDPEQVQPLALERRERKDGATIRCQARARRPGRSRIVRHEVYIAGTTEVVSREQKKINVLLSLIDELSEA